MSHVFILSSAKTIFCYNSRCKLFGGWVFSSLSPLTKLFGSCSHLNCLKGNSPPPTRVLHRPYFLFELCSKRRCCLVALNMQGEKYGSGLGGARHVDCTASAAPQTQTARKMESSFVSPIFLRWCIPLHLLHQRNERKGREDLWRGCRRRLCFFFNTPLRRVICIARLKFKCNIEF